jgi:hypothetical protein
MGGYVRAVVREPDGAMPVTGRAITKIRLRRRERAQGEDADDSGR